MNPLFRTRRLSTACLSLLALTLSITALAQSAQEIVARHIEALGGKEKLQSINSLYIQGVAVMGDGKEISTRLWKVYDRLYRQEVNYGTGPVVTIVTPSRGWMSNPLEHGEFKALPYDQLRALQPQIDPAGPLADYNQKGCVVALAGTDTVNGNACYRIRLSCPMGQSVVYSIDQKSFYILRETRKGGPITPSGGGVSSARDIVRTNGEYSIEYSDYKQTPEGYVFPYTIVTSAFGTKMTVSTVEVNHNVNVDGLSRPR